MGAFRRTLDLNLGSVCQRCRQQGSRRQAYMEVFNAPPWQALPGPNGLKSGRRVIPICYGDDIRCFQFQL